ncbi:MAG: hypothetical protein P1R58_09680 [bacterium]|nr:hypothetical protein [bacterium]
MPKPVLVSAMRLSRLKPQECNAAFQKRWGEVIGRMHALQTSYKPPPNKRPRWHEDKDIVPPEWLSGFQPLVHKRIISIREKLLEGYRGNF